MADSPNGAIARAVRARRIEMGLSVEQAAEQARVHVTSWRLLEEGVSQPSALMIGAVCRVLSWTPARFEKLLHGELRVDAEGEVVVDLDEWPASAPTPPVTEVAEVVSPLETKGLTPRQLDEVQNFIDYLRREDPD